MGFGRLINAFLTNSHLNVSALPKPSVLEAPRHTPQLDWSPLLCRNATGISNEATKFQSSAKFMFTHYTDAKGHSEILFQKQCSQSQRLETLILFSSSSHMSSETWISKGKSLTTFFFLCPFWAICDKRALFDALAACGSLPVAPASEPC